MAKIDLETLASGYQSTANLNTNFQAIEDEFNNNVLYRNPPSGEPNQMQANIDLNSNKVINAADGINNADYVTVRQLNASIAAGGTGLVTRQIETKVGSEADGSNKFTLTGVTYSPGANNLDVYMNGQRLRKINDYTETSSTEVTLTFNPKDGADFDFITNSSTTSTDINASNVTYDPAGSSAVATTVQAKLRESVSVKDFGAISDGTTDETSIILTAAASGAKFIVIPYNTKYDPQTLLATLPTDVVLFDQSMINSFDAAGETTKEIGIFSKDTATSDTHLFVGSDHHAIMQLSNFGGAGTTSADERKASFNWSAGKFENGSAGKNGWRGAAIKQFTKESSGSYWVETLRSIAPWVAIDNEYERWKTGEVISGAGVYRTNSNQHYVSTGAGTTGATGPSHTSGTVSDGGVSWTWVDAYDRTIYQIDEYNRVLIGSGAVGSTFRHKVGTTDPVGNYVAQFAARGASKNVSLKFYPTTAGDVEDLQPYFIAQSGVGLRVFDSGGTELARWSDDEGTYLRENARRWTAIADGDATPSVAGAATLYTQNTSPTSITALDDGDDGQVIDLVINDANTTLVNSSTLMLDGGVNLTTPAAYTVVTFQKVPTSISDRWIEVSRCVK